MLFAIVPAILFAYALPVFRLFGIIKQTEAISFGRLWITYFHHWHILVVLVVGFLLCALSSAFISSTLTYHMRIGQLGLPNFFSAINNDFFPCLVRTASIVVALIVHYSFFILMDSLWNAILVPIAAIIVSAITFAALCLLLVYIVSSLSTWLPTMVITGQSPLNALRSSFLSVKHAQKSFFVFYLIIVAMELASAVIAFYLTTPLIAFIISALTNALAMIFAHVFWFIAYFHENNLKRADLDISSFKRSA